MSQVLNEMADVTDVPTRNIENVTWPPKVDLFGVGYTPTNYEEAVQVICCAAKQRTSAIVSCHAVHAVMTFCTNEDWRTKVNTFDMITPDGQPVRWALNLLYRAGLKDRVYGPELMDRVCRQAAKENIPIYLYGGTPEVLEKLEANLRGRYTALQITGSEAPPFRQLTEAEDHAVVQRINQSEAGIVFIGLGCPKQDLFAFEHRSHVQAVQICVGAAFDFHAGVKATAPAWMRRNGLEWLFRLSCEPRRLWKRYLHTNSLFVAKLIAAMASRFISATQLRASPRTKNAT
jgi:N-acetylglucosaminyldiphosphoundecaprenol N-acetyl-beta-D-mannosaminyltransferase